MTAIGILFWYGLGCVSGLVLAASIGTWRERRANRIRIRIGVLR